MYRLALSLALLIVLAAGCGGSGDDDSKSSSPSAVAQATPKKSASSGATTSEGEKKGEKEDADAKAEDSSDDDADDADEPKTHEELEAEAKAKAKAQYSKASLKRKLVFVRTIATAALSRFGLVLDRVELTNGGRHATLFIRRKSACRAVASQEKNMTEAIKVTIPALRSIRYEVSGTGQELGYYVLSCPRPKAPNGPGQVVLTHTGVGGPWTSRQFEIKSKRWALEYENHGNSLAVIAVPADKDKEDRKYVKPVTSQKPEGGRLNYKGPGRFLLKVHGAGQWTVRVKEIR